MRFFFIYSSSPEADPESLEEKDSYIEKVSLKSLFIEGQNPLI